MKKGFNELMSRNIRENAGVYFIVFLFFAIGIAAGAFTVKALDDSQKQELVLFLNRFFQVLDGEQVKGTTIFFQSLKNNFQTVLFIWLLSVTIIGLPFTLLITGFRGFIIGFTISFLIKGLGWKGLLFTSAAVLPQNIIYIPCLIAISAISLSYSLQAIRRKFRKNSFNQPKGNLMSYTVTVSVIFGVMLAGSLIEAYISPLLIRSLTGFMIVQ